MTADNTGAARSAAWVSRGAEAAVVTVRSVIIASPNLELRSRLTSSLTALRWLVREAAGGAEALAEVETLCPEALLLDSWLPDLETTEFAEHVRLLYPAIDLLRLDGVLDNSGARSPRRNELLHAIREVSSSKYDLVVLPSPLTASTALQTAQSLVITKPSLPIPLPSPVTTNVYAPLPGMIGYSAPIKELVRLIRLVAPRSANVLIEGETGTGKEVVARSLHRFSRRSSKPFAVLNCAAIPEALLEAELFGHTRGAFTGAVQSRTGRIEAANGGTLFLDEIGEMPMALQAKLLRFLDSGELQRVGDNEMVQVDVRIIAATHQHLEERSAAGTFRLDLYHRLAVFPLQVPALRERMDDLDHLVGFFLDQMGREMPRKGITPDAFAVLSAYHWPGNVRELMHVLLRAEILAEDRPNIGADEIRVSSGRTH